MDQAQLNEFFRKAVILTLPQQVSDALAMGANVDVSIGSNGASEDKSQRTYAHALLRLLAERSFLFPEEKISQYHVEPRQNVLLAANMIISYSPDLMHASDTGVRIIDRLIVNSARSSFDDKEFISTIGNAVLEVLAQNIERKQDVHTYNLAGIFGGIGFPDKTSAQTPARLHAAENLALVHEHVRQRLRHPQTMQEKHLSRHADKLDYWLQPLMLPDLDSLPKPSHEMQRALEALQETMRELTQMRGAAHIQRALLPHADLDLGAIDDLIKDGKHVTPGRRKPPPPRCF